WRSVSMRDIIASMLALLEKAAKPCKVPCRKTAARPAWSGCGATDLFALPPWPAMERGNTGRDEMADQTNRILLGKIGAAHGIRGEVRLVSHTQDPAAIAAYGPLETDRPGLVITIAAARRSKNVLIARLAGISDRNAAEALNGVSLYIDRDRLPAIEDEDDFYHADLI